MRRVVEYPFRRRTSVRQRRISAREKVKYDKNQREAAGFPSLNFELILAKSLVFNRPLSLLKIHAPSLFRSALF